MRPRGVTNHFGRIHIPNDPIRNDEDFKELLANIRRAMFAAIDQVMTCEPDYLILGMSSETFWDGIEGSMRLRERVEARAGVKVAMGSDASQAALKRLGDIRRIGVITPYMPVADEQVRHSSPPTTLRTIHLLTNNALLLAGEQFACGPPVGRR